MLPAHQGTRRGEPGRHLCRNHIAHASAGMEGAPNHHLSDPIRSDPTRSDPMPSDPTPSHPVPSHLILSRATRSHPIPPRPSTALPSPSHPEPTHPVQPSDPVWLPMLLIDSAPHPGRKLPLPTSPHTAAGCALAHRRAAEGSFATDGSPEVTSCRVRTAAARAPVGWLPYKESAAAELRPSQGACGGGVRRGRAVAACGGGVQWGRTAHAERESFHIRESCPPTNGNLIGLAASLIWSASLIW